MSSLTRVCLSAFLHSCVVFDVPRQTSAIAKDRFDGEATLQRPQLLFQPLAPMWPVCVARVNGPCAALALALAAGVNVVASNTSGRPPPVPSCPHPPLVTTHRLSPLTACPNSPPAPPATRTHGTLVAVEVNDGLQELGDVLGFEVERLQLDEGVFGLYRR